MPFLLTLPGRPSRGARTSNRSIGTGSCTTPISSCSRPRSSPAGRSMPSAGPTSRCTTRWITDLFLKIADRFKVAYVPQHWANFRWFGGNKSATCGWDRMAEIGRITKPFGGRGLPAYMRIEGAFLDARISLASIAGGHPLAGARSLLHGVAQVAASPRAWKSLTSPACWRVMRTGITLRRATQRLKNLVPPTSDGSSGI